MTKKILIVIVLAYFAVNCRGFAPNALAQEERATTFSSLSPVLSVSAGVLPTSLLYALDKFDEWMQVNIFAFGIGAFRAEAALQNAAERIAELQTINAMGTLTDEDATDLSQNWLRQMNLAAATLGRDYMRGGRPLVLTGTVARTMMVSLDALQDEQISVLTDVFFNQAENQITSNLLPDTAGIPDQIYQLVVDDLSEGARQVLSKTKAQLDSENAENIFRVGSAQLLTRVEEGLEQANLFYANRDFGNVLLNLREARQGLRLIRNDALLVEINAIIDASELDIKLDAASNLLLESGLLEVNEIDAARKRVLQAFRSKDAD